MNKKGLITQKKYENLRYKQTQEPNPEQFNSYEEYRDASIAHKIDQVIERNLKPDPIINKLGKKLLKKINEFKKKHKDFDSTMEKVEDVVINDLFSELVLTSKIGPEVLYHLSKNPKKLKLIVKMNPLFMLKEFDKIERSLNEV